MDLDSKDKKILTIISDNARIPVTQLAAKVGLSKDAVGYRLEELVKKGAIESYITYLNLPVMGYTSFQVTIRMVGTKEEFARAIAFLSSHPFCINVFTVLGRWDLLAEFVIRNEIDAAQILTHISERLGDTLEELESKMVFFVYKQPSLEGVLTARAAYLAPPSLQYGSARLDEKDVLLISELSNQGRKKLSEVCSATGLERDVVTYRKKQLEAQGIIQGYRARLNISFFGYTSYYLLMKMKNVNQKTEDRLRKYLGTHPAITYGFRSAASFEAIVFCAARSPEEFHTIVMEIRNTFLDSIHSFETLTVLKNHHYTLFPQGLREQLVEKSRQL